MLFALHNTHHHQQHYTHST